MALQNHVVEERVLKLGRGMALSAAFLGTGLSEKWSLMRPVPVSERKKLPRGGNSPVCTAVPQGARLSTKPWNNSLALTKAAGVKGNSWVTLHSSPQEFQTSQWESGFNLLSLSENSVTCYILHPKTVPKNVWVLTQLGLCVGKIPCVPLHAD